MNGKIIFISVLALLMAYGCQVSSELTFQEGIKKLDEIEQKHGASLKMPPNSTERIDSLVADLNEFESNNKLSEPMLAFMDFKLKYLESSRLYLDGWKWGKGSTTDYGFGCKGYARIKESAAIRNQSAQKGYEAAGVLNTFLEKYPEEAKIINLTRLEVMALNASYYQVAEKAAKDAKVIEGFCGAKAKGNLTE